MNLTRGKVITIFVSIFLLASILHFWASDYYRVGRFGSDYRFEKGGMWVADYGHLDVRVMRANYTLDARVLSHKVYKMHEDVNDPTCTFSPVDLFLGIGDVRNNTGNYDFHVEGYDNRIITYRIPTEQQDYFRAHVGNNHMIPHNENVYWALLSVQDMDLVVIRGDIVKVTHPNGGEWDTGTEIGDSQCEVILLDEITINGRTYNEASPCGYRPPGLLENYAVYVLAPTGVVLAVGLAAWTVLKRRGRRGGYKEWLDEKEDEDEE